MCFNQEFLADRERHLTAKLAVTQDALGREDLLPAARKYKLSIIEQINAAQNRLTEGTYGYCIECDGEIPKERLLRHPHVACCVPCQTTKEKSKH